MCEYCKTGLNLIDEWSSEERGDRFAKYLWIEGNRLGVEVHHEAGNSFLDYVDINYCPICGDELNKGGSWMGENLK